MYRAFQAFAISALSLALGSCTSLYFVHDPQTGLITAGQLPGFLQSIRCELVTFYQIERLRKKAFERAVTLRRDYQPYRYFEVASGLYGAFTLELKVTDDAGIGSGTSIDSKHTSDATHYDIWHIGPTLSGKGTYDLIWTFLMKQNAELAASKSSYSKQQRTISCFRGRIRSLHELEKIAADSTSERARFTRILVDGAKPLAAWLRDNGTLISAVHLNPMPGSEAAEPAQMYYSFAVQVSGGVEAKYSLFTPQWNPLAAQGSVSLQQNSNLQIYINGPGAVYANGAKSGSSGYPAGIPLGSTAKNPIYVVPTTPGAAILGVQPSPEEKKRKEEQKKKKVPVSPPAKGYLLAPPLVFPPAPSQ